MYVTNQIVESLCKEIEFSSLSVPPPFCNTISTLRVWFKCFSTVLDNPTVSSKKPELTAINLSKDHLDCPWEAWKGFLPSKWVPYKSVRATVICEYQHFVIFFVNYNFPIRYSDIFSWENGGITQCVDSIIHSGTPERTASHHDVLFSVIRAEL